MSNDLVPGLDAGVDQGIIPPAEWREIAETHGFLFARCEQAMQSPDSTFAGNVAGARAAGMIGIGCYCVFIPGIDPKAQAESWFRMSGELGTRAGELPIAIDFEEASKTLTPAEELDALVITIEMLEDLEGREPLLYTYPDFWKRIVAIATAAQLAVIARCLLWYASYSSVLPKPPAPWTRVTFWQWSGGTGYKTPAGAPCDADYFLGTSEELAALASFVKNPAPAPVPAGDPPVEPALDIPTSGTDDEPPPAS